MWQLVASVVGALGTLLGVWLTWYLKNREGKQKQKLSFMSKDFIEVQDIMNHLLSETGCARVLVLKANNHGHRIRHDVPLFSSVVYEMRHPDQTAFKSQWQYQRADAQYAQTLEDLVESPEVVRLHVNDLPEGDLRNAWVAYDIEQGEFVRLWKNVDGSKMLYMSVSYGVREAAKPLESSRIREAMRYAISHLRNAMKEIGPHL